MEASIADTSMPRLGDDSVLRSKNLSRQLTFSNRIDLSMSYLINCMLTNLPDEEFKILSSNMQLVSLKRGISLFDKWEIAQFIYFPIGATVSMLNDMEDGTSVEVYTVNNTGVVGMGMLGQPSPYRAQVRNTGLAYRLPSHKMQEIRNLCPVYLKGAYETSMHMLMQMSQNIACSKRHSIEQQLARWMLNSLDRTLNKHIQITHQEISEILGFRREAITLNLAKLSSKNIIKIKRGGVEVIDRVMMEDRSCECYWTDLQIDRSFSRLTTSISSSALGRALPKHHSDQPLKPRASVQFEEITF